MLPWIDVAAVEAVREGEILAVSADGTPLALCRLGDSFFALYDRCPHGGVRLSEGFVENGCIECPLHQGLVDIVTGEPRSAPIKGRTRIFPVRHIGGRLEVQVDATSIPRRLGS